MTTSNKPQILLDSEIQEILKSIAKDSVDSFKNVTRLLTVKAQQVDWDKLKSDTIKVTAQSSAFCYKQFKKVDWMEVFEILVSGLLILGRGVYLAGFYTGKAMYWVNDQLSARASALVSTTAPGTSTALDPEPPASTATTPSAGVEYSDTPSSIPTAGLEHWSKASDQILGVLEECHQSTNENIDELLEECDQMIKENDLEIQQYHDETVVSKDLWDLIAETADQQHQAMTECMEPPSDPENFEDSIYSPANLRGPMREVYEMYNAKTVKELRDITGMHSKKYKKDKLVSSAIWIHKG